MWADTILIVFISVCTALLGEGLTWLMVYRTEKYQKLKAEVEKQSKKLEKRKEAHGDSLDKQQKKKIEREEERLKNNNRDLSLVKMKSMFAIGFAFTALLSMFNNIFDGRVVARLPFVPISWIQGLSHRNLPGEDYTECSFIFLYILCTMSIRQVNLIFHLECMDCLYLKHVLVFRISRKCLVLRRLGLLANKVAVFLDLHLSNLNKSKQKIVVRMELVLLNPRYTLISNIYDINSLSYFVFQSYWNCP